MNECPQNVTFIQCSLSFSSCLFAAMILFITRALFSCLLSCFKLLLQLKRFYFFIAFIVLDTNSDHRRSKGYGFVTFEDKADASDCIHALDGTVSLFDRYFFNFC